MSRSSSPLPAIPAGFRLVACLFTGLPLAALLIGLSTPPAQAAAVDRSPPLLHEDGRIRLPAGSPYADRIATGVAETRAVRRRIPLPATVEADPARTVTILPPLTGRIVDLKVQIGDRVSAGQILAVLQSPDLAQAWSDRDKAADAARLARTTLERARALMDSRGGALKDVLQAESDASQARAELERANSRLATLGLDPVKGGHAPLSIRSPASGTVVSLSAAIGAYVNDATQPLMTVANLDRVWVTAGAPEEDAGLMSPGMAVDLVFKAFPDRHVLARVTSVSPVLDPDTRRVRVRIALPNGDGRLKPNMFATAAFEAPGETDLVVPVSALLMNNDRVTVLVEIAPGLFERRTVTVGTEEDGQAIITSGLAAGEHVVTRGGVLLND